jgi:hypothetical protein
MLSMLTHRAQLSELLLAKPQRVSVKHHVNACATVFALVNEEWGRNH